MVAPVVLPLSQRCPPRQTAHERRRRSRRARAFRRPRQTAQLLHTSIHPDPGRAFRSVPSKFRALPLVLVMVTASTPVFGQRLTCFTVRPGDTAARLAQRFTGNTHNRHQAWFQIVNPNSLDLRTEVPLRRHSIRLVCLCGGGEASPSVRAAARGSRLFPFTSRASNERRRSQHPVGRHALRDWFSAAARVGRGATVRRPETGNARHHEAIWRPVHFRVRTAAVSQAHC